MEGLSDSRQMKNEKKYKICRKKCQILPTKEIHTLTSTHSHAGTHTIYSLKVLGPS
jgi:hypothetical protein